jgi:CheY-like chemotaxis protein
MKGNLLIIDDETELVYNLKQILAKYADNVYYAFNGADGMRALKTHQIHCVICDIYMPGMTGIDVIKAIREEGNKVPFIFFTAYGMDEIKAEAAQYPRTVFLIKPDIKEITLIISKMLKLGLDESHENKSL